MIQLRWLETLVDTGDGGLKKERRLQFKVLFYPHRIGSGDIVLAVDTTAKWENALVETDYEPRGETP